MESKLTEGSHCLLVAEFLNPYSEFRLRRTGADYKGPISPLLLNPQLICWIFKSSPIVKYLGGDEKSSDYKLAQLLHRFIPFLCKWRFSLPFWKMGQYLPWACHGWSCNSSIIQTLWFPWQQGWRPSHCLQHGLPSCVTWNKLLQYSGSPFSHPYVEIKSSTHSTTTRRVNWESPRGVLRQARRRTSQLWLLVWAEVSKMKEQGGKFFGLVSQEVKPKTLWVLM